MAEEPAEGIRPLWLVGGAAATLIIGVCALLSILALGGVLWLTQSNNNRIEPTQVIGIGAATQAATRTLAPTSNAPAAPTALPAINPTAVNVVPPTSAVVVPPGIAPEQAVRTYFQFASAGRYDVTWQMLSENFKQKFNCCAPSYNYTGYLDWWDSVNTVEFGQVRTVSQTGDRAVVYAELYYVMNTGERSGMDSSPYIELVYDPAFGGWRFDDKRSTQ